MKGFKYWRLHTEGQNPPRAATNIVYKNTMKNDKPATIDQPPDGAKQHTESFFNLTDTKSRASLREEQTKHQVGDSPGPKLIQLLSTPELSMSVPTLSDPESDAVSFSSPAGCSAVPFPGY